MATDYLIKFAYANTTISYRIGQSHHRIVFVTGIVLNGNYTLQMPIYRKKSKERERGRKKAFVWSFHCMAHRAHRIENDHFVIVAVFFPFFRNFPEKRRAKKTNSYDRRKKAQEQLTCTFVSSNICYRFFMLYKHEELVWTFYIYCGAKR